MGKTIRTPSIWTASLACLALAVGCGGGGGGSGATFTPPNTTISGQATAAVVSGGMAEVYSINANSRTLSLVGSSTTNAQGQFSVSLQGSGPFLVLVRGGSYTDEATGATRNLGTPAQPTNLDSPRGNTLEGVVGANVNGSITVNLSPLTTMASRRLAQISQGNPGVFDPGAVASVNRSVAQEFGLGAVDPSGVIPVDFTNAANAAFIAANPNDAGVLLGAVLSGLSQLAVDLGVVDPMDVVEALAQDFSDGVFNGAMGSAVANQGLGVVLGNAGLPQNTATTQLSSSTANFLDNNANNNSGTNAAANNGVVTSLGTLDVTPGGNTAPFFDGIPDQNLNLNLGTTNVPVTTVSPGAPSGENGQTVTLMATSSDPSVLPNPVITGTGATRNLALSPNSIGTVTVTISAMDGGGTANAGVNIFARTFVVSIFSPNRAPSFTMIQDQTLNEDGSSSFPISNITATEANQTITSVTATSSNTALLPNPAITGSGASRTITLSPVADAFGTSMVTVTVVDDGGTANGGIDTFSQTFMVTVTSVNDQPTFDAIPNQNVSQGSTMTQMVTISNVSAGPANENQALTFTAISSDPSNFANPTITGSGATRTLSFTPNANAMGTTTITVTAMDTDGGNDTLQRTFTIMVVAPAGVAQVSSVVPPLASSLGGTNVRVATSQFMEDFTVTAPTANVGGMSATITVVNATTIDVTVPTGLTVGTTSIQVMTPTDVATFASFEIVAPVTMNDVIINEVLYDPSGSDTNNDGVSTSTEDEYVEFVNTRTTPVDITGFQMTEGAGTRHVFTNPTTIPAGGCIVLFGGGTPTGFTAAHGNGAAQTASSPNNGGLGLNNGGDTVTFLDPSGVVTIDAVTFGQGTPAVSINRNPDADPTAPFVLHTAVPGNMPNQATLGNYSTALKVDQTPHGPAAPMASIDTVVPGLADLAGGTNIAISTSNFGDFTQNSPTVTVGGSTATIMNVTANTLVLQIPTGLSAGTTTISITNANGTANFTTFLIVPSVTVGDVFINEFLADPGNPATVLDANGDGTPDETQDEFVELVNNLSTPVDISGFQMTDSLNGGTLRHSFPNPTTIPANGSIVVFGGGTPTGFAALHMNGAAQTASSGTVSLNNTGDTITLIDPAGPTNINQVTYATSTDAVSANRMTDADPTAAFADHTAVANAVGAASPGAKVDGTPHGPVAPSPTIDTVIPAAGRVSGGTTITLTASNFGDFTQNAPTVSIGGTTVTPGNVMAGSFTFDIPTGLTVGTVTVSVMNTAGTATFTTFEIVADVVANDLIVNEYLADPTFTGGTFDANGDGNTGTTNDEEYVEYVNTLTTPIDISGFQIFDAQSAVILRHTFPNPTVIPAGGSIVVFGGGTPTGFPTAQTSGAAQTASTGSLILNNGGDSITLRDTGGTLITEVTWTSSPNGNAATRMVDGDPTSMFVDHSTITAAAGARGSPGTKVDGTSFP